MGLKSTISGPFFIENLVGVGCRLMVPGPRLGTLVGTLEPMPLCALWAHVGCYAGGSEYFAWDDAKNATLKADRGIGFEDIVFHIERGDLLDILHPKRRALRRPAEPRCPT
jgi:hypothetical protein